MEFGSNYLAPQNRDLPSPLYRDFGAYSSRDVPEFGIFGLLTFGNFFSWSFKRKLLQFVNVYLSNEGEEVEGRRRPPSYSSSLFDQKGTKEQKFNNEKRFRDHFSWGSVEHENCLGFWIFRGSEEEKHEAFWGSLSHSPCMPCKRARFKEASKLSIFCSSVKGGPISRKTNEWIYCWEMRFWHSGEWLAKVLVDWENPIETLGKTKWL